MRALVFACVVAGCGAPSRPSSTGVAAAESCPAPPQWLSCSPLVTTRKPLTIEVAPGTDLALDLGTEDSADLRVSGLPDGATFDATTGAIRWRARALPAPAVVRIETRAWCGTMHVRVARTPRTEDLRMRTELRDQLLELERAEIPTDENIRLSLIDGEDPVGHDARVERELARAHAQRASYEAQLACGYLPGGGAEPFDVDGDGVDDALIPVSGGGKKYVLKRTGERWLPAGSVSGSPTKRSPEGYALFIREDGAENWIEVDVDWVDSAGNVHSSSIDAENGSTFEWIHDESNRVTGLLVTKGSLRVMRKWTKSGFVIVP